MVSGHFFLFQTQNHQICLFWSGLYGAATKKKKKTHFFHARGTQIVKEA